jgi:hypothetical protein
MLRIGLLNQEQARKCPIIRCPVGDIWQADLIGWRSELCAPSSCRQGLVEVKIVGQVHNKTTTIGTLTIGMRLEGQQTHRAVPPISPTCHKIRV